MNKNLAFDEMTVGDMLSLFDSGSMCGVKAQYLKFGTDLRAAWDVLHKDDNQYDTVCTEIGLEDSDPEVPDDMVKAVKPFLMKDMETEHIRELLHKALGAHLLDADVPDDEAFKVFEDALFKYLVERANKVGVTVVRTRRTKQKKK